MNIDKLKAALRAKHNPLHYDKVNALMTQAATCIEELERKLAVAERRQVPGKPTLEMCIAGINAYDVALTKLPPAANRTALAAAVYTAMITSAPEQPE